MGREIEAYKCIFCDILMIENEKKECSCSMSGSVLLKSNFLERNLFMIFLVNDLVRWKASPKASMSLSRWQLRRG